MDIKNFEIEGLFGDRNVSLPLNGNALVLVGPNGLGKSSVVNIFYYAISRQWSRLLHYNFHSLRFSVGREEVTLHRDEMSGLLEVQKLVGGTTSRISAMVERLIETSSLEQFIQTRAPLHVGYRKKISELTGMPLDEVGDFHRFLSRRLADEGTLFSVNRAAVEEKLQRAVPSRVVYLPTYRRIERDLRDIFPVLDERYRRVGVDETIQSGRSGAHYIELVSFGMEDVRQIIARVMGELRGYSLTQYNNLSASYLRDVIKGEADDYVAKEINSLDDYRITKILNRVSETALSREDKEVLRGKIKNIQNKEQNDIEINDRYLAHYFSRLVEITSDISAREASIASFVAVCNQYLNPDKSIVYDEITFAVKIVDDRDRELDLSVLSSGEKQIVSLFSHLYLDETKNQIVIIDEPELSLSVPWQRMLLPDILNSGRAAFLLAVTHSPFVYENELKPCAVDLKKLTTRTS
jgi:predicted ATP-dependent endonuclease of OLD family